jgi:uroporphyrinogen-III synthase
VSSQPSSQFLPLSSQTILVTRAAGQSSQFTTLLQQQGASVIEMPALEIRPPSSWAALDRAIVELATFDWLILTSTNGVEYFLQRLEQLGRDRSSLGSVKIAVVGQKTAACLRQHGLQPDFIPPDFVADALIQYFPERERLSELKLLFPRVETGGREVLVKELTAQGATVVEVAAYESGCAQTLAPEVADALQRGKIDILTFASSKTVTCFYQLIQPLLADLSKDPAVSSLEAALAHLMAGIKIASIGPQTSATCQQRFGRVDIEAEDYTLEGLTRAIVQWATNRGA